MRVRVLRTMLLAAAVLGGATWPVSVWAEAKQDVQQDVIAPVNERFSSEGVTEEPDFQRHVSPLFGRLGCNGRSCHGSFQGRGGFRLSLFGYDFKADHEALLDKEHPRVVAGKPLESKIIIKPTDENEHEGGERYKKGSWEHHLLSRWIEAGAKFEESNVQKLLNLEITPSELQFTKTGEKVQLKAVAVWSDGSREDVTPICRFQSNSDQICTVTETGLVTATDKGDTHVVVYYDSAVVPVPAIRPVSDLAGAKYPNVPAPTKIDQLVVEKLRKLGVVQAETCTDAEYLRRISLDLTGTLPTVQQVQAFLDNPSPNKRKEKVDELLSTPAYAAWWTTKLCDFTGNNDRALNNVLPVQNVASQSWYDWIYKRVSENVPYDQLAAGIVLGKSREADESYTKYCEEMSEIYRPNSTKSLADRESMPFYWARNNLRQPEEKVIAFAYTFLGIRIQCAQCHKHPFDQWSKEDFEQFKGFFTRVTLSQNGARDKEGREEYEAIVAKLDIDKTKKGNELRKSFSTALSQGKTVPFGEVAAIPAKSAPAGKGKGKGKTRAPAPQSNARLLGGEPIDLNKFEDAREPLMDWLRSKDNPYFAKAFVNRVWANYFNVGIVEPPDDLSLANPPSNKPLLDYLAQGFIENNFDMKWLHREIAASRTYQLSWQTNETNAKDERNFARSVPRRLPAEVAYDALMTATASDDRAAKMLAELKGRGIAIAGGSASNNARSGGGDAGFALKVFGRSIRESNCDCDRSMEASLLQTVYLQNDNSVLGAISGGRDTWIDQVTRELRGVAPAGNAKEKDAKGVNGDIAQVELQLRRAEKRSDEKQIKRLGERLAELQKAAKATKKADEPMKISAEDTASIVRDAYLRTLSRYPTPEEMNRCTEFIASSEDPIEGARGVLWTLVNTKEFIVNH